MRLQCCSVLIVLVLMAQPIRNQFYMYNPNANSGSDINDADSLSGELGGKRHYGQPIPSSTFEDPADVWDMTSEEKESKKENPLPYIINPAIRRGTQSLGHLEAHANRDARRKALMMPLLNLVLNPSRRR